MHRKKPSQLLEAPQPGPASPEFKKKLKELVAAFKKAEKFTEHASAANDALLAAVAFVVTNDEERAMFKATMIPSKVSQIHGWAENLNRKGSLAQQSVDRK